MYSVNLALIDFLKSSFYLCEMYNLPITVFEIAKILLKVYD